MDHHTIGPSNNWTLIPAIPLGPTTEVPTITKDTVALITGGIGNPNVRLSSTEVYPPGCSLPALPEARWSHTAFVHNNSVSVCGGKISSGSSIYSSVSDTSSCLVLDVENQRWEKNVIGDLTRSRTRHAAVSVENVGTYLIGGGLSNNPTTTDFLASGLTEWSAGPALPVSMYSPCAVKISQFSFLVIKGFDIREYHVDIANPTSFSGWQQAIKWPRLQTYRDDQPGCALTNDNKVVIAGGWTSGTYLKSSEVLDLATRKITNSGDMTSSRRFFHLATTTLGGETKIFAFGGRSTISTFVDSVEHFHPNNNSWTLAPTTLKEKRGNFGRVVVGVETICPT